MPRIVFVFVDGLGLGDPDAPENPVRHGDLRLLANFLPSGWRPPTEGGRPPSLPEVNRPCLLPAPGRVIATDASLDLPGLPQSATGQTALFTGVNAARVLGRHLYGFPTRTLQRVLRESSVLKRMVEQGRSVLFVNAFRPIFFELGEAVWQKPLLSATTWANHAAGLGFRSFEDLRAGRAVYQDITHDSLPARGIDVPLISPEEAGANLAALARDHDFTLFEFFQTDKAGHARDEAKAVHELVKLERFLAAVSAGMDADGATLLVTSDHGNIEDLGTKSHTHNPVPTLILGAGADRLAPRLGRLEDFAEAILDHLGRPPED